MANADTPEDALAARQNGAEGIGLCRTEHMVIPKSVQMICSNIILHVRVLMHH
jgi:phosphoenolpyruvate synthase/pyruvate phosphate dikinase